MNCRGLLLLSTVLFWVQPSAAVTLTFEGIAPPAGTTSANDSLPGEAYNPYSESGFTFSNFAPPQGQIFLVDQAWDPAGFPEFALTSDILWAQHPGAVQITFDGKATLASLDVGLPGSINGGAAEVTVVGTYLVSGLTIASTFVAPLSYLTHLVFDSAWRGLSQVTISTDRSFLALDNITFEAHDPSAVPAPPVPVAVAAAWLGLGAFGSRARFGRRS